MGGRFARNENRKDQRSYHNQKICKTTFQMWFRLRCRNCSYCLSKGSHRFCGLEHASISGRNFGTYIHMGKSVVQFDLEFSSRHQLVRSELDSGRAFDHKPSENVRMRSCLRKLSLGVKSGSEWALGTYRTLLRSDKHVDPNCKTFLEYSKICGVHEIFRVHWVLWILRSV